MILAAAAVGCGVWLLVGPLPSQVRLRRAWVAMAALATGGGVLWVRPEWSVQALLVGAAALAARAGLVARRRRGAARTAEEHLLEACELIAADLRAGLTPETALARAATDWPALAPVAAAADLGVDVPGAFRVAAAGPGQRDLLLVAGAWQVSQRSGSALAAGMTRVAGRLRQARSSRAIVRSELASARATARLLAVLPFLSLAMGSGVGGDPVRFLVGTPWGFGCLASGLLLDLVGLWWIDRLAESIADAA